MNGKILFKFLVTFISCHIKIKRLKQSFLWFYLKLFVKWYHLYSQLNIYDFSSFVMSIQNIPYPIKRICRRQQLISWIFGYALALNRSSLGLKFPYPSPFHRSRVIRVWESKFRRLWWLTPWHLTYNTPIYLYTYEVGLEMKSTLFLKIGHFRFSS